MKQTHCGSEGLAGEQQGECQRVGWGRRPAGRPKRWHSPLRHSGAMCSIEPGIHRAAVARRHGISDAQLRIIARRFAALRN